MIRIAVIGCGKAAEKHLKAYKSIGADITVTDIVPKGEKVAKSYGFKWHPDPNALIRSGAIDAVDVCTPTPTHFNYVNKALNSGKHVFCEKPLCVPGEDEGYLVEKATQANRILMVGYPYRFHLAYQFTKEVIDNGILGMPYFAIFRVGGRGSHKAWKHLPETGGGAYNEMVTHMLDMAGWLFGEFRGIESLYRDIILQSREIEGKTVEPRAEDVVLLKVETMGGVKILCEADLLTPSYMNSIEIQGTNGSLWTSILEHFPTVLYCKEATGDYWQGYNFFKFPKEDLFEKELAHFIEQVEEKEKRH